MPFMSGKINDNKNNCLIIFYFSAEYSYLSEHENDVLQSSDVLVCPAQPHRFPWFTFKCKSDHDCHIFGEQCCQDGKRKICRQGVKKKGTEPEQKKREL